MSITNERIKGMRLKRGLTLVELSELLNVKAATVQRYESGAIKNISHEMICKLSEVLRCSPSYLMGWEDAPDIELTDIEKQIIRRYRILSPTEKEMLLRSLGLEKREVNAEIK